MPRRWCPFLGESFGSSRPDSTFKWGCRLYWVGFPTIHQRGCKRSGWEDVTHAAKSGRRASHRRCLSGLMPAKLPRAVPALSTAARDARAITARHGLSSDAVPVRRHYGFALLSGALAAMVLGTTMPTPVYPLYAERMHFAAFHHDGCVCNLCGWGVRGVTDIRALLRRHRTPSSATRRGRYLRSLARWCSFAPTTWPCYCSAVCCRACRRARSRVPQLRPS
jgi:hypothetical protein